MICPKCGSKDAYIGINSIEIDCLSCKRTEKSKRAYPENVITFEFRDLFHSFKPLYIPALS